MDRFQKKCVIVSAGFHLLLAAILIIGPAFLTSQTQSDNSPILEIIPSKLIDGNFSGGGSPNAKPPPVAPMLPKAAPVEPPPKPDPIKLPDPDPPKETVKDRHEEKIDPDSLELKDPKRQLPQISLKKVVRKPDVRKTSNSSSEADAQAREFADRRRHDAELLASTARNLREDVSPSTGVEMDYGPNGGGPAYASYDEAVRSIYWHAWVPPEDATSDKAVAKASVTISRDGRVTDHHLIVPSGDTSVDRSIERTLQRVGFIAPFPEGSKDKERTYTIRFDLNAKRLNG